jgi:hypothetical protein
MVERARQFSFVIYHPGNATILPSSSRATPKYPKMEFRPMVADERFISWSAQEHMVSIAVLCIKFPVSLFYWGFWLYIKARLPGEKPALKALSPSHLNGLMIKPENCCR